MKVPFYRHVRQYYNLKAEIDQISNQQHWPSTSQRLYYCQPKAVQESDFVEKLIQINTWQQEIRAVKHYQWLMYERYIGQVASSW